MTGDQVREQLVKMLAVSREGTKVVDPMARAFSSGRATGIEDALKLKVLQAEQAARIKAAAQRKERQRRDQISYGGQSGIVSNYKESSRMSGKEPFSFVVLMSRLLS